METTNTRATDEQMVKIRRYIIKSPDASDFAKKAVLWLLRKSENLTKPVSLSFARRHESCTIEVCKGIHDMDSANGQTRLSDFLKELGINEMFFYYVYPLRITDDILHTQCVEYRATIKEIKAVSLS